MAFFRLFQSVVFALLVTKLCLSDKLRNDFYNLHESDLIYPASHVSKNVASASVIECCMFCTEEESCLAVSYVTDSKTCYFVNKTVSIPQLSIIGKNVSNSQTLVKEDTPSSSPQDTPAAPCADPSPDNNGSTNCASTNHQDVVALLAMGDRDGVAFLGDGTFVYCSDTIKLRLNGYNCDAPLSMSNLDVHGWFTSGPPEAAVEDLVSGNFFLFKGDMIYQFESSSTKPHITPCNGVSCWSSKTITEHYGDWAPVHPDAVFNHEGIITFIKGNMIYQEASPQVHIHDVFPKMPCGVTAVDRLRRYPSNLVYAGNKIFYLTPTWLDSYGPTCFK